MLWKGHSCKQHLWKSNTKTNAKTNLTWTKLTRPNLSRNCSMTASRVEQMPPPPARVFPDDVDSISEVNSSDIRSVNVSFAAESVSDDELGDLLGESWADSCFTAVPVWISSEGFGGQAGFTLGPRFSKESRVTADSLSCKVWVLASLTSLALVPASVDGDSVHCVSDTLLSLSNNIMASVPFSSLGSLALLERSVLEEVSPSLLLVLLSVWEGCSWLSTATGLELMLLDTRGLLCWLCIPVRVECVGMVWTVSTTTLGSAPDPLECLRLWTLEAMLVSKAISAVLFLLSPSSVCFVKPPPTTDSNLSSASSVSLVEDINWSVVLLSSLELGRLSSLPWMASLPGSGTLTAEVSGALLLGSDCTGTSDRGFTGTAIPFCCTSAAVQMGKTCLAEEIWEVLVAEVLCSPGSSVWDTAALPAVRDTAALPAPILASIWSSASWAACAAAEPWSLGLSSIFPTHLKPGSLFNAAISVSPGASRCLTCGISASDFTKAEAPASLTKTKPPAGLLLESNSAPWTCRTTCLLALSDASGDFAAVAGAGGIGISFRLPGGSGPDECSTWDPDTVMNLTLRGADPAFEDGFVWEISFPWGAGRLAGLFWDPASWEERVTSTWTLVTAVAGWPELICPVGVAGWLAGTGSSYMLRGPFCTDKHNTKVGWNGIFIQRAILQRWAQYKGELERDLRTEGYFAQIHTL